MPLFKTSVRSRYREKRCRGTDVTHRQVTMIEDHAYFLSFAALAKERTKGIPRQTDSNSFTCWLSGAPAHGIQIILFQWIEPTYPLKQPCSFSTHVITRQAPPENNKAGKVTLPGLIVFLCLYCYSAGMPLASFSSISRSFAAT